MPWTRSLYPKDWETIALAVKEEARWTCEECGKPCRRPGQKFLDFAYPFLESGQMDSNDLDHPQRFTLTVSHTDHNPANCDRSNLRALCAPCHCRYDQRPDSRVIKNRLKLERNGQLSLGV